MPNRVDRVGFLVPAPDMVHHFEPVWRWMDPDEFELVVLGSDDWRQQTFAIAADRGWHARDAVKALHAGLRWDTLVSNHPGEHVDGTSLALALGERRVRFMYALGKSRNHLAEWNALYDMVLCYGPWHVEQLAFAERTVKVQMGYPRYDRWFTDPADASALRHRLGLPAEVPVLLWLPTWGELSSIDRFTDHMASLRGRFHVVAKVHPFTLTREPERMARLRAAGLGTVVEDLVDNLDLFRVADQVVCDYGGTPFGAIYLDRPLALLDVPGADEHELTGPDSIDVVLRRFVTHADESSFHEMADQLLDPGRLGEQEAVRLGLRQHLFAPHQGFAGRVAALALQHREHLWIGPPR